MASRKAAAAVQAAGNTLRPSFGPAVVAAAVAAVATRVAAAALEWVAETAGWKIEAAEARRPALFSAGRSPATLP